MTATLAATRRSFRNERMRDLFDRAVRLDWTHKIDGSGHVRMTSPDGRASMTLSITANDRGRAVANNEASLKRWLILQNTITRVSGLDPAPPVQHEDEPMGQDLHALNEAEADAAEAHDEALIIEGELTPDEDGTVEAPAGVFFCADGCGKPVSKEGGYARGHNPNSQRNAATARAAKVKVGPSLFKTDGVRTEPTFTVDEVITIATFGGDSGIIEVSKLRDGLILIGRMRQAER